MPQEHPQIAVPSPALLRQHAVAGTACPHTSTHSIPSNLPSFLIKVLPEESWRRRMCVHLCTPNFLGQYRGVILMAFFMLTNWPRWPCCPIHLLNINKLFILQGIGASVHSGPAPEGSQQEIWHYLRTEQRAQHAVRVSLLSWGHPGVKSLSGLRRVQSQTLKQKAKTGRRAPDITAHIPPVSLALARFFRSSILTGWKMKLTLGG